MKLSATFPHAPPRLAVLAALGATAAALLLPAASVAEQASQPSAPEAARLDVSGGASDVSGFSCYRPLLSGLSCWGFGGNGSLGYGTTATVGDDETPGSAGAVDVGADRTLQGVAAGAFHTCGVLNLGAVRCWGFGAEGRLGYRNEDSIGDNELPSSVGPVDLGGPAAAVTAGTGHSCALLQDQGVRCWGFGDDGRLGYGNVRNIGDDETPASAGPVYLGVGSTARAISAGDDHTCAILSGSNLVRCWGWARNGALGYGNTEVIGDDERPGDPRVAPVDLGTDAGVQRTAAAISAGDGHTCAVLDNGRVRCWGFGGNGRLGYVSRDTIGDNEKPGTVGPVDLGTGNIARAITAGDNHTCGLVTGGNVYCWGFGGEGQLGYANRQDVGDNETPGSVGPVDLGAGRTALAVSAGGRHTCALLDDQSVRCWGDGALGRLGYCNETDIGDDETPGSAGPVNLAPSSRCTVATPPPPRPGPVIPPAPATPPPGAGVAADPETTARAAQARRRRALRSCYAKARRHTSRERRAISRLRASRRRARAKRHMARHRASKRRACAKRHGRTPGRVTGLSARAGSRTTITLSFSAAGTHGTRPPAAHSYLIKQSTRPIRSKRAFRRAQTLCRGRCRFDAIQVGAKLRITVAGLRPGTTYHYAVSARDNVSKRLGRRSKAAKARTRL